MVDINVFSFFFVTEIMSLIISYQPIAVLSQAQWWPKLVCVQSPVSYFQRRYVSCWNSCGMNTLPFSSCLSVPTWHFRSSATVSDFIVLSYTFPFFSLFGLTVQQRYHLKWRNYPWWWETLLPHTCLYANTNNRASGYFLKTNCSFF